MVGPVSDLIEEDESEASNSKLAVFEGTVFDAALDASRGTAWKHTWQLATPEEGTEHAWTTQWRLLSLTTLLLGVSCQLADVVRDRVADVLGVPALLLREMAGLLRVNGGYRASPAPEALRFSAPSGEKLCRDLV